MKLNFCSIEAFSYQTKENHPKMALFCNLVFYLAFFLIKSQYSIYERIRHMENDLIRVWLR